MARLLLSALVFAMVAVAIQARNAERLPKQYVGKHVTPEREQALRALQRSHNSANLKLRKRSLVGKIPLPQAAENHVTPLKEQALRALQRSHNSANLLKRS
ncbi:hypothetical protein ONE63_001088 [Megalurothrips usitatus]|uniref:Uncharacterized protein n=1 Tax=Megalurothrips usitatus TaxID=439358 RepID=A0AAV7XB10_9NEOP|nr:hypothetical protein ONE63_001088 [Megalurothrips usitatus]